MNNSLTPRERAHVRRVKELACAVCGASGPSEAHHIEQHQQYTVIPLCTDCHRGNKNGLHGERAMWRVMRKTEMSCLNETIRTLYG